MPDYKSFARGIDFYHGHEINWDIVMPHIDFGIAKCSESTYFTDPDFAKTVEEFYKRDKPLLAFHYYDGKYYPSLQFDYNDDTKWVPASRDLQLQRLKDSIRFKKIYGQVVDLEEFGNTNVPNSWMSKGARVFTGRVRDYLEAEKPVKEIIYSRQSYINQYAPDINNWIHNYDTWVAQWWWSKDRTVRLAWEDFEQTIPPSTAKVYTLGASTTWKFWQYSGDRFIFPGVNNNQGVNRTIDLNLFNGTVEQLHDYLGFIPGQVPPPTVEPVVTKYKTLALLNIRCEPKLSAPTVGTLPANTEVNVFETKNSDEAGDITYVWGRHSKGWSAINSFKVVKEYMRKV